MNITFEEFSMLADQFNVNVREPNKSEYLEMLLDGESEVRCRFNPLKDQVVLNGKNKGQCLHGDYIAAIALTLTGASSTNSIRNILNLIREREALVVPFHQRFVEHMD